MSTQFALTRDINGYVAYGLQFAFDKQQLKLSANTAETLTAPTNGNTYVAVFSYEPGTKVWVSNSSATITPPSGAPTSTTAELLPAVRQIEQGSTLQFITSDTSAEVGVSFYVLS